jgi:TldD protein
MKDKIIQAIEGSKADYTEIRIEEREASKIEFRGENLETANAVVDTGGIVRCLVKGGGWGITTFNNLSDLPKKVEQAYQLGKVAKSEEPIELSPVKLVVDSIRMDLEHDFRNVSLAEKKDLAERYNNLMLDHHEKIVDTNIGYDDTFSKITYATSEGIYIEEDRPMVTLRIRATARDGDNVQLGFESVSGQRGFDLVQDKEELVRIVGMRAVDMLDAKPVKGGQYPVVLNSALAGVFIHEAFGHLSEADFVYENPQAQEMMVLGRRFGKDILNVYDDGSILGERGSHRYDDEGTLTKRNYLIKDGILVGRLHSRETAAKMGEEPSGNARATGYRYQPIVRMTNTAIEQGETTFDDMIGDIELGVYACNAFGGQTYLENFSFSSAYAYMIRDGKIAEMVKDVILAGNLFTTLLNIDAIGNDFQWYKGGGMCGKGQGGLPVAMGSPHIRIQDVVIGGE